jgi:hypothetical protein
VLRRCFERQARLANPGFAFDQRQTPRPNRCDRRHLRLAPNKWECRCIPSVSRRHRALVRFSPRTRQIGMQAISHDRIVKVTGLAHRWNAQFSVEQITELFIATNSADAVSRQVVQPDGFTLQVFLERIERERAVESGQGGGNITARSSNTRQAGVAAYCQQTRMFAPGSKPFGKRHSIGKGEASQQIVTVARQCSRQRCLIDSRRCHCICQCAVVHLDIAADGQVFLTFNERTNRLPHTVKRSAEQLPGGCAIVIGPEQGKQPLTVDGAPLHGEVVDQRPRATTRHSHGNAIDKDLWRTKYQDGKHDASGR